MKVDLKKNSIEYVISRYGGVLICGDDVGMIQQTKHLFLDKIMPDYKTNISLINITPTTFKEKQFVLYDEYNTRSLWGDKKLILFEISDGDLKDSRSKKDGDKNNIEEEAKKEETKNDEEDKEIVKGASISDLSKILTMIFTKINKESFIVLVFYGMLKNTSSLRKFAENNINIASVTCYIDNDITIKKLIEGKLSGYKYDYHLIEYLASKFGGDRMIILNEMDKLLIYKGNDKNITQTDVSAVIQDNSSADFNNFINSLADFDVNTFYLELQKLQKEDIFPIVLIRTAIFYFLKIHLYRYRVLNGESINDIVASEFWKNKDNIARHLKNLSLDNINQILILLFDEERKLKGKHIA
jgi:DNA polymerase III delta subunit